MTRFGLTAAIVAAGVLLWSSSANADTITLNGAPPVTHINTNVPGSGLLFTISGAVPGIFVAANALGAPRLPAGEFNSQIEGTILHGGTFTFWFTETGLTSPVNHLDVMSGLTSNFEDGISSVTESTFVDHTNTVAPPPGTPVDTHTFFPLGPDHQSFTKHNVFSGTGPFSLQEEYMITSHGFGDFNLTIDMKTTPVPEPATLLLFGTGLLLLGVIVRRKQLHARAGLIDVA